MKLYFLRHASTETAENGLSHYGTNPSLSVKGKEESLSFYNLYSGIDFSCIYCSESVRTQETVSDFGVDIQVDHRLNELNWGQDPNLIIDEISKVVREWRKGKLEVKTSGGESYQDIVEKFIRFLSYLESKHGADDNILICSHGRTLSIIISYLLKDVGNSMQYLMNPAGLTIIDPKSFSFDSNSFSFNERGHLLLL